MITAPLGVTNPQAGVMTTKPATAPEQKPRTLGLPLMIHSTIGQTKEATAVARVVVVKALAAMPSEATALPALNPYQPTQSMPVPTMHRVMLWGLKFSLPKPRRLPEDQAQHQGGPAGSHVNDRAAGEVDGVNFGVGIGRRRSSCRQCPRSCGPGGNRRRASTAS